MSHIYEKKNGIVKRIGKKLCRWCGEGFEVGCRYVKWSSVSNDGWWNVKLHEECHNSMYREVYDEDADFSEGIEKHERKRGMTIGETKIDDVKWTMKKKYAAENDGVEK
jgi:hypothetical protein